MKLLCACVRICVNLAGEALTEWSKIVSHWFTPRWTENHIDLARLNRYLQLEIHCYSFLAFFFSLSPLLTDVSMQYLEATSSWIQLLICFLPLFLPFCFCLFFFLLTLFIYAFCVFVYRSSDSSTGRVRFVNAVDNPMAEASMVRITFSNSY